jgi:hypothetical protein
MAKAEVGVSAGVSAQRIYQDLVEENGFTDSTIARRSSGRDSETFIRCLEDGLPRLGICQDIRAKDSRISRSRAGGNNAFRSVLRRVRNPFCAV